MRGAVKPALVLSLLVLSFKDAYPQASAEVRRPRGIYATVYINYSIEIQKNQNPSITPPESHAALTRLYRDQLDTPEASGLAIQVGWDILNPGSPASSQPYDWSYLDDAFASIATWNAAHPGLTPKTVQVSLFPGYFTPAWVLDQIPSCDGLFMSPPQNPPANCGTATFAGFNEPHGGYSVLPLPWNSVYKSAFKTFLAAFAARYGSNPAFVSMDVAGPTAASSEIIVPQNGTSQGVGDVAPNDMWRKLLMFAYPNQPACHNSDQAFIDEWNTAIDMFGQIFNGVTLIVWHGSQLINFASTGFTIPPAFADQCTKPPTMDCAAEATIYAHFIDPAIGGSNAKAVAGAGLTGRTSPISNILKWTSQSTAQFASPSAQVLEGSQFSTTFSTEEPYFGCTVAFPPDARDKPAACTIPSSCTATACIPVTCIPQACLAPGVTPADIGGFIVFGNVPAKFLISPEQGLYNALKSHFDGTPAAVSFGGTPGTIPENYLQVFAPDLSYSASHAAPAIVVKTDGTTQSVRAQDLLNLASQKQLSIGEPAPEISEVSNAEGENPVIAPNTWVEIKGSNLSLTGFDRIWAGSDFVSNKMPTALNGVSATVNGKSAYVYYVSASQVNILTPPDAMSGPVQVQVTTNGQTAGFTAQAQTLSPSFFVFNGGPYVAATHANGSLVGPTSLYPGSTTPAKPGETIVVYANGFGPTSTPVISGSVMQSGTLSPPPVIKIGGVAATVTFAGLVLPGEFQFNVVVPPTLADGDQPITATYVASSTQGGTLLTVKR